MRAQGLASKTRLNGVWVARRNLENLAEGTMKMVTIVNASIDVQSLP